MGLFIYQQLFHLPDQAFRLNFYIQGAIYDITY